MVWREVKNKRVKEELQHLHEGGRCTSEGDTSEGHTVSHESEGLLIRGVESLLSVEMSELIWMLLPPLRSLSTTADVPRIESETEPWQWLQLCSWSRSEARRGWAQERGFSTTEQILPLIRNGHGRTKLSQSATGLDIANNLSLVSGGSAKVPSKCIQQV